MAIKNLRADLISDYIKEHKERAYQGRQEPYEIAGKRQSLDVMRLPINLLCYNIRNGRFAAELHEFEVSEGLRLEPEKSKDAEKIEELLLKDKTKTERTEWLKKDLVRVGQLYPATITHDGYIINGNRRAAILSQLFKETGDEKYSFLETVILPPDVSPKDLWRFEAGFQLAVELKADYGPVNELLKIKEGIEYGLPLQEIALTLGGDNTVDKVKQKLRILTLIEDYLNYFGQDKRYSTVERRVEHFINLDNIRHRTQWKNLTPDQEILVLHAAYHLIHDADIAHLEIRGFAHFVKDPQTAVTMAKEILVACGELEVSEPEKKGSEPASGKKIESITLEPSEDELKKLEDKLITPPPEATEKQQKDDNDDEREHFESPAKKTKTPKGKEKLRETLKDILETTKEKVTLNQQKNKPNQIFKRIESNLVALDEIPQTQLKTHKKEFQHLEELFKKLAKKFR
ncbi:MAG: hypothetical protein WC379_17365 [Methanoregula sp.]|jgi:hypothetical protein